MAGLAALSACSDDDRAARLRSAGPEPSLERLLEIARPEAGARLFGRCAACHTIGQGGPNRAGPNLFDIVGKPIAANPSFGYTHALKTAGGIWDAKRLDAWLAAPSRFAPGTRMTFAGLQDPLDRADVIAYLGSQAPAPAPQGQTAPSSRKAGS